MTLMDFDKLNNGINALIAKINQLERENNYLRKRESNLLAQTRQFQQQNQQTQEKIQNVITRLKTTKSPDENPNEK